MDIQRAFTYITDDEKWVTKLLIGVVMGLLGFLILPSFILTGYGIQIARNVRDGYDVPLPEWDNFGKYLSDGFIMFVAGLIYGLPAIALIILGGVLGGGIGALGGGSDAAGAAIGGTMFLFLCLALLYGLALFAVIPAVYIQFIRHGTLGACLQFSEVIALTREYIGQIAMTLLAVVGIGVVVAALNFIPCIGQLISLAASAYILVVLGHMYGQIAAIADGGKGDKMDAFDL